MLKIETFEKSPKVSPRSIGSPLSLEFTVPRLRPRASEILEDGFRSPRKVADVLAYVNHLRNQGNEVTSTDDIYFIFPNEMDKRYPGEERSHHLVYDGRDPERLRVYALEPAFNHVMVVDYPIDPTGEDLDYDNGQIVFDGSEFFLPTYEESQRQAHIAEVGNLYEIGLGL